MSETDPVNLRTEFTRRVLGHDYSKGPLLLFAGPGTGKTFSLLETIKYQLERDHSIPDFYETTLTNAAADDFLEDARAQISPEFDSSSTLHFRAKGILHQNAPHVGINPNFMAIDSNCEELLIQDLAAILGKQVSEVNDQLRDYRESSAKCISSDQAFCSIYQDLQSFYSAVDWFDVVSLACKLLENNKEIRDKESQRFRFLLIDEYQDLNPADQKLVQLLNNERNSLLAVGDDDQSIYSGRFSDPSGIVNFTSRYPTAEVLTLPVTSRLPSKVASASYQLICINDNRHPKDKVLSLNETDRRADEGFVFSVNNKSDKAEKEFLYEAMRVLLEHGVPPKEILVLCNCRALGLELVDSIRELDDRIPIRNDLHKIFDVEKSQYLLDQIRRFLSNAHENLPLRVILSELLRSKLEDASDIVKYSFERKLSIWRGIHEEELLQQLGRSQSAVERLKRAVSTVASIKSAEERLKAFLGELKPLGYLLEFLPAQQSDADQKGEGEDPESQNTGIRFITLHSSKGLDADFIFIPFMEESIGLPGNDIEEQRRLLYVALTRAKVGVVMTWAWSRRSDKRFKCSGQGGEVIRRNPSPFIRACGINPNLVPPSANKTSVEVALGMLAHHCQMLRAHL